jgi:hypothetical protein
MTLATSSPASLADCYIWSLNRSPPSDTPVRRRSLAMPTTVNYFAFSLADPEHCAERFAGRPESARQRYVDDELVGPVGVGSI